MVYTTGEKLALSIDAFLGQLCHSCDHTLTLIFRRYYYLCLLKANKKFTKNSLEVIYFSVLLLLLIHALLPVITNAAYGIYYPKPSNTTCFANGGRGIFAHDIFGFLNMLYFMSNTALIIFASWKSLKIIKSLLLSAVKSTASNEKQVQGVSGAEGTNG